MHLRLPSLVLALSIYALFAECRPSPPGRQAPLVQNPLHAEPNGTQAIEALVRRRLPASLHSAFELALEPETRASAGNDTFAVTRAAHGQIKITASSTSALSRGLLVCVSFCRCGAAADGAARRVT
jgi:hypothetical protein